MGEGMACGGLPFPGTGCPIPDVDNLCFLCIDFYVWDAVYIFNHPPRMFLSTDFAFQITDWTCCHGPHLHAILRIISRGVSGLAIDSPCGVWGRGWTTSLLHDNPLFDSFLTFENESWYVSWSNISYIYYFAWKVLASVVLRMPPLLSGTRSPSPSNVPNPLIFSRAIWRHICLISHINNCNVTFQSYCVFSPSFCLVSVWYHKRFWAWRLVAVEIGAIENWHCYYYHYYYYYYYYYFLPRFTVSCMELVIFLLYNNLFIYQVLCTLIYRRRSLYSFLYVLLRNDWMHMPNKSGNTKARNRELKLMIDVDQINAYTYYHITWIRYMEKSWYTCDMYGANCIWNSVTSSWWRHSCAFPNSL